MTPSSRLFVAGHRGLVGSALVRRLREYGYTNIVTRPRATLDLGDARQVDDFFRTERPEYVFLAAGKVGGIEATGASPAEFIHTNLTIQAAALHAAYRHRVARLVYFGSACMYPRDAVQPLTETALMTGPVEPTSEAYAVAKLAGLTSCQAYNRQYGTRFLTVIPAAVYGPNDHFDVADAPVLPALIRKFHAAKTGGPAVVVWGTGSARREFIHADDLADACLFLMNVEWPASVVNVGVGEDIAIKDLAGVVHAVVGSDTPVYFDSGRPEGPARKRLDSTRMRRLGWTPKISLEAGIAQTYAWYRGAATLAGAAAAARPEGFLAARR